MLYIQYSANEIATVADNCLEEPGTQITVHHLISQYCTCKREERGECRLEKAQRTRAA